MIKAVLMACGSVTRSWPFFRSTHSKQFLALDGLEYTYQYLRLIE